MRDGNLKWIIWMMINCMGVSVGLERFGLLTVTHARDAENQIFMNYLQRYAQMECTEIMQINVVWNNEKTPQQMGAYAGVKRWKRPIYFKKTISNQMNFRYLLHQSSKAELYFNIDDDIIATCQQLVHGFQQWKSQSISSLNIGPLMSYGPRSYDYKYDFNEFTYQYAESNQYQSYALLLIGIAWIPRHYINLYYLESWQADGIRRIIRERNNCDDIGLNVIINHYYPQFRNVVLKNNMKMDTHPEKGQSNLHNHIPYRNQCLKEFINILGYNPLAYALKQGRGRRQAQEQLEFIIGMRKFKLQELFKYSNEPRYLSQLEVVHPPSYLYETKEQRQKVVGNEQLYLLLRILFYMMLLTMIAIMGCK